MHDLNTIRARNAAASLDSARKAIRERINGALPMLGETDFTHQIRQSMLRHLVRKTARAFEVSYADLLSSVDDLLEVTDTHYLVATMMDERRAELTAAH